jgi:hypothetical protein
MTRPLSINKATIARKLELAASGALPLAAYEAEGRHLGGALRPPASRLSDRQGRALDQRPARGGSCPGRGNKGHGSDNTDALNARSAATSRFNGSPTKLGVMGWTVCRVHSAIDKNWNGRVR